MNSRLQQMVTDEELEYYAERYVQQKISYKERIIFEHYLQREIMLKHRSRSAAKTEQMKKSRLQSAL